MILEVRLKVTGNGWDNPFQVPTLQVPGGIRNCLCGSFCSEQVTGPWKEIRSEGAEEPLVSIQELLSIHTA